MGEGRGGGGGEEEKREAFKSVAELFHLIGEEEKTSTNPWRSGNGCLGSTMETWRRPSSQSPLSFMGGIIEI